MRQFEDADGTVWTATVAERPGVDYKGRFHLVMEAEGGAELVALSDVRWNTERTAARTLDTMSQVELRRRLRSARGRTSGRAATPS